MKNKRFLNFLLWYYPEEMDISDMLAHIAHQAGLKINFLVDIGTLRNNAGMDKLKRYVIEYGDDITVWLEPDNQMLDELDIIEGPCFFCYYSRENKYKLAKAVSELYENKTGRIMRSIAYFNLDADALASFKETCPSLICAMAACFEEGINVLHGHRYFDLEWLCWTEGGPWSPWIPRKGNALVPAAEEEKLELVCVPHLNRDLMQAFDRRNDWYSSQPMDEMRGKSVRENNIEFSRSFFAENMKQAELNDGFAYYQFLEGFGPFDTESPHVFDEDCNVMKSVYEEYVKFLGDQVKEENIINCSLAEFGRWYYNEYNGASPSVMYGWHDLLHNTGKEYLWYIDHNIRVMFSTQCGGSVLDLRPYKAEISKNAGVSSEHLWNLSNPFVIQNHHRYTSIFKGMVKYEGELIDLSEKIFHVKQISRSESKTVIVYQPLELVFKDDRLILNTQTTLNQDGDIITEREVVSSCGKGGVFEFCEYLHGTLGTTDLPTDLRGTRLEIGPFAKNKGLIYSHLGRAMIQEGTNECRVGFPKYSFYMTLKADGADCKTRIQEGTLFQAFYTLSIDKKIKLEKKVSFRTVLSFSKSTSFDNPLDESSVLPGRRCPPPFKNAWGPSKHPLRCPECLHDETEVHLLEQDGVYRCQFCSFTGTVEKIQELYRGLIPKGCR